MEPSTSSSSGSTSQIYSQQSNLSNSPSLVASSPDEKGQQPKLSTRIAKNLVAGALARSCSASLMHPIDVVKTRMQFQRETRDGSGHMIRSYKSTLHALRTIVAEEGIFALYKGLPVRLIYITPAAAVSFTVYEQFMNAVKKANDSSSGQAAAGQPSSQNFNFAVWRDAILTLMAGATARIFGTACRTPFDILKQRLQVEGQILVSPASETSKELLREKQAFAAAQAAAAAESSTAATAAATVNQNNGTATMTSKGAAEVRRFVKSEGIVGTLKQIIKVEGARGLWGGYGVTVLRDAPFSAIYFTSYEGIKRLERSVLGHSGGEKAQQRGKSIQHFIAGACAGAIATTCTIPVDVVKTRLQTQGKLGVKKYDGILHAFKTIYHEEGPVAFTKGLGPRLTYIMPAAALTFTFYEKISSMMGIKPTGDGGGGSV